jgi:hypothetical protein
MPMADNDSGPVHSVASKARGSISVHGPLAPQQQQELKDQLEAVLAFADFCTYLTAGRVADRARPLADLAQALYSETTEDLRRAAIRGS